MYNTECVPLLPNQFFKSGFPPCLYLYGQLSFLSLSPPLFPKSTQSLMILSLNRNNFMGSVPMSFSALHKLETFSVSMNSKMTSRKSQIRKIVPWCRCIDCDPDDGKMI